MEWIILQKHGKKPVNPSIKIYINKKENGTTFTTKTRYYLEITKILKQLKQRNYLGALK